tara:strand:+ start:2739 stop:5372 length:2634 start_codon:yes stop_codon:yes gene_type:complete
MAVTQFNLDRRKDYRRADGDRRIYTGKFEGLERREGQRRESSSDRRILFAENERTRQRPEEISIRALFSTLWRGKLLILFSFIIVMSLTVLIVQQLIPRYTASASVMINSRKLQVVDVDDVLSNMNLDAAIVQTEVEVIRSRKLVKRVVEKLHLDRPGAFSQVKSNLPAGDDNSILSQLVSAYSALAERFTSDRDKAKSESAISNIPPNPAPEDLSVQMARKGIAILDTFNFGDSSLAESLWTYVLEKNDVATGATGSKRLMPQLNKIPDSFKNPNRIAKPVVAAKAIDGPSRSLSNSALKEQAIDIVLGRLQVNTVGRSLVIDIAFTSENPKLAADVANSLSEQYLESQLDAKTDASQRANKWLNSRIIDLRARVLAAEKSVELYRAKSSAAQGNSSTVSTQQLAEINSQVIIAQTKRSEAVARYRVARNLMAQGDKTGSAAEVFESRAIVNLRKEETKLLGRASELSARYENVHPKMIKIMAEVSSIQKRINSEIRKIVEGLKSEVEVAKARETSLRSSLKDLQRQVSRQNQSDVKLRELQREAKANRQIYEAFLGRFKEVSNRDEIQEADARIISAATVPTSPSYPRKNIFYGLGGGASLFLGLMLVFIRSRLDNRFKTPDEIEQASGVPALGMIPFDKFVARKESYAEVNIFDKSLFTEAIRSLHTWIFVNDRTEESKVLCVTSSLPSEGKTITTLSLARVAAMSGQKVVIVDCDLRRPSIHRAAKVRNDKNIVDLLNNEANLEDVVTVDKHSGAHLIPSKVYRGNPLDLLRSQGMENLVAALKLHYDFILLDTPSILAVSDPKVLSRLATQTLYLVKWDGVPKDAVLSGIKSLVDLGTNFVGVTMTQVDLRKHQKYGYSSGGYYYGSYQQSS